MRSAGLYRLLDPVRIPRNSDLIDFPTIVWQEVEYSVYTMRQASRRSWRIGQRRPVRVVYLAYWGTLQAQALTLVAKKLKASLALEGELGNDGLSTFGDDGEDLFMALARSLTERVETNEESLEGLFADLREYEQTLEVALDTTDAELPRVSEEAVAAGSEPAPLLRTLIQVGLPHVDDVEPEGHVAGAQQLRLF